MANPDTKDTKDIKITIDGKDIEVKAGSYLIEAAKELGVEIPTYCYHELLPSRPASCRMCLVEIEGNKKLQASCATPVMDGMVISTTSEMVLKARASQNEFMLSNHALDCPVCDKGGECELQDSVVSNGPHEGKHAEQKLRFHDRDYELSPVIVKDSNRCVQCMRCTRVCTEVVGAEAIGTIGRGVHQEETSFFKTELDCDQCGMCIEVCPTGCFMRAPYRYSSRPWDNKAAATVCTSCGTGCRMTIEQRDGTVVRSLGKLDEGFNSMLLCATGRFGYDVANSEDRVTRPMVKKNGKFEVVTWEEALGVVKDKLNGKVGGIISPKLSNEDHYLFKKLFKNVLKSNNIDSDSRWSSSAVADFIAATGIESVTSDIKECLTADTMLVVGGHLSDENPVTEYMVRTTTFARPMSLVIASPRGMKLDLNANLSVRNIPGSEGSLLSGIEKSLGGNKTDSEAKKAGLSPDDIKGIADRFKRSEIVSILAGTDLIRYGSGAGELSSLVEKLKADGKTVFVHPLLDRGNQRGAWNMGVLPADGGLGAGEMIEAASKGELDTLHIVGEDVLNMFPDRVMAQKALDKIKFLVVQESFMTDTAQMADVVLPSATMSEREGTFTNQEGRVQKADVLMAPKGDSLPDYEIIASIGQQLDSSFGPYYAYEIFSDITGEVGSYGDIKESDFEESTKGVFVKPTGGSVKVKGGAGFKSANGDGSFTLITGNHLNLSGTETGRSEILTGLVKEAFVELSVADASELGINEGDAVKVSGGGGEFELTAKVNGILKGNVFISENFSDSPVNKFFTKGEVLPKVSVSKVN